MISRRSLLASTGVYALLPAVSGRAQVAPHWASVLTRGYDNNRTGWNAGETVLDQDSIRTRGVQRFYSLQMEGDARGCEAAPLIVPNVLTRTGYKMNLAIQASMSDGLWCFNADTGEVLWAVKLGMPIKGDMSFDMYKINDNWGILGTPVIDPTTNILYCVTWTSPDRSVAKASYYVHAVHVADGSPAANPVALAGATFDPSHGLAKMTLGTIYRKQRTALLLVAPPSGKLVVVCFAAGAESAPTNHGWVIALSVNPFKIAASWVNTPHWQGGGIWLAAGGPCADANGDIYLACGNGSFDGVTDFGESFVKLRYANGALTCIDNFTPFTDVGRAGLPINDPSVNMQHTAKRASNDMTRDPEGDGPVDALPNAATAALPNGVAQANMAWTDQDLGSAGVVLIPKQNLLIGAGKDGILYSLDKNNLGQTKLADFANSAAIANNNKRLKQALWFTFFPGWNVSPTPTNLTDLNVDYQQRTHHQHSTPVYYESPVNGPMLFTCGENGPVRAWSVKNQKISYLAQSDEIASPNAKVPPGGMTGGMMCASSNGTTRGSGLLVVLFPYGNANKEVTDGFIVIYDPDNFDTKDDGSKKLRPLWKSSDWNIGFKFSKFNVPVVSGGKIFVPTYEDKVDVYSLA